MPEGDREGSRGWKEHWYLSRRGKAVVLGYVVLVVAVAAVTASPPGLLGTAVPVDVYLYGVGGALTWGLLRAVALQGKATPEAGVESGAGAGAEAGARARARAEAELLAVGERSGEEGGRMTLYLGDAGPDDAGPTGPRGHGPVGPGTFLGVEDHRPAEGELAAYHLVAAEWFLEEDLGDRGEDAADRERLTEALQHVEYAISDVDAALGLEPTPVVEPIDTPAEDANETLAEDANETLAEDANETLAEDANETPAEDANETPAEDANETLEEDASDTPAEGDHGSLWAGEAREVALRPFAVLPLAAGVYLLVDWVAAVGPASQSVTAVALLALFAGLFLTRTYERLGAIADALKPAGGDGLEPPWTPDGGRWIDHPGARWVVAGYLVGALAFLAATVQQPRLTVDVAGVAVQLPLGASGVPVVEALVPGVVYVYALLGALGRVFTELLHHVAVTTEKLAFLAVRVPAAMILAGGVYLALSVPFADDVPFQLAGVAFLVGLFEGVAFDYIAALGGALLPAADEDDERGDEDE